MDSRIRIVPAAFRHVNFIARRMREIDRLEVEALGRTPKQALRYGLLSSSKAWTALVDLEPHAMFGVVEHNALTREASPWFLGTDEVYRHGRELLMWGPGFVSRMCDSPRRLSNLVSAENRQAIRLLQRWGFTVDEKLVDVNGTAFRYFEKVAV